MKSLPYSVMLWAWALFTSCSPVNVTNDYNQVDTLSAKIFFTNESVCDFASAKNYTKIKPTMIPWATDNGDPYAESYIINNKKLTILQPLRRDDLKDSSRLYTYDEISLKTIRVINDTLKFNFNAISIDYSSSTEDIFFKGNSLLLMNQPMGWSGLSNKYRFVQLFDLSKFVCYEFIVDYYSCINYTSE